MNVLIVGGGGREHAIAWALSKSEQVEQLYCAPGNGGIAALAQCVPLSATDVDGVVAWAQAHSIDFVVVAPDDPLALGMVDALEDAGIPAFPGIAFFFHNHFNTIHHLHFIHLRTVLSVVSRR